MRIIVFVLLIGLVMPASVKSQGCMEPSSDGGVNIIGYIQPQWNLEFKEDAQGEKVYENSFLFNRARLGVTGQIPYDFSYYAMAEFSPMKGGPYMLDFFITYHGLGPWANVSFGQFKQPFGLELSTPCHALHTIDRSMVVNEMASPFRDMGVMVYGGTDSLLPVHNMLKWQFAVVNGTGKNVLDNNKNKDIMGRLLFSPLDFLTVGGSYRFGKQLNPDTTIEKADERMRWGVEASIKKYNFLLQGEYINGTDKGSKWVGGGCGEDPTLEVGDFKSNGFWAMLLYDTPWKVQPLVKYQMYDPDTEKDFNKLSSWTFGVNWFFNDWTRLQVNYVYNIEESSSTNPADYHEYANDMLMVQLQVLIQ